MLIMKKVMFFDMDGVLADFEGGCNGDLSKMFKRGFFRNLSVMEEKLDETIADLQEQGYIVKILSKACVKRTNKLFEGQVNDKVEWVLEHIPSIAREDIIIQATDEIKADVLKDYPNCECYLVDDYSMNLLHWEQAGGKCIKRAKRIKFERTFHQILNVSELAIEGI